MEFNPWSLPALASSFFNFGLALHVIQRNPRALANRAAGALGFGLALWLLAVFLWDNAPDARQAMTFARVSAFGWAFLSPIYLTVAFALTGREHWARSPVAKLLMYGPPALIVGMTWRTDRIIAEMIPTWYGYSYRLGTSYGWYLTHALACCGIAAWLFRSELGRPLPPRRLRQMQLMYASTVLIFLIAIPVGAGFALLGIAGPDILAPASALAVDLTIFIAILRYRLFVVTPEAVSAEILATIPEPVILLDEMRRVIEMNPAALMLTGSSLEGVRGIPIESILAPREAFALEEAHHGRPGGTPEVFGERPAALVTSEGKRVPIALSQTNVWDEFGQVAGSVLLARDLRRAEEMQARLVQSEKLASIGQVAAGVAHEVNNPTTYILTNVRRLKTLADEVQAHASGRVPAGSEHALPAGDDRAAAEGIADAVAQIRDIASDCEEGAIRIKNIVQSLSVFSRMPTNHLELVDLNAVIESAIKIVDTRVRPAADLERDYGDLPRVMGDTGALGQVMLNLALNAVQAVEATGRRGRIEIHTSANPDGILIDFRDSGTGIPPEILPHVFDPFFTTKRAGEGTGLGLAICLDIIRRHGGDISVQSSPDAGSLFRVTLPLGPGLFRAESI